MNFLKRVSFNFFSAIMSSSSSESEKPQEEEENKKEEQEEEEEEVEEVAAPIVEKKPPAKRERSPSIGAEAPIEATPPLPKNEEEDASSYEIDYPKGNDRMRRSATAKFEVQKRSPRDRVLVITVQKGKKKTKTIECPFIDFPEDVIAQLKAAMELRGLDYMDASQAAVHAPKIFWNAIHHFGSIFKLDEELEKAGVPNGKRSRVRATKRAK